MKIKLLILVLLATTAQASWAQMEKGSWFLRGNAGINYSSNHYAMDDNSLTSYPISNRSFKTYTLSPGLGYMLRDHWMVGVEGIFKRHRFDSEYIPDEFNERLDGQYLTSTGFGVFGRRFFILEKNFQIFVETGIGMGGYTSERNRVNNNDIQKEDENYREYEADLAIGIHYRILKNLSIEMNMPLMGFSASETKSRQNSLNEWHQISSTQTFSFKFGSDFQLGINFIF